MVCQSRRPWKRTAAESGRPADAPGSATQEAVAALRFESPAVRQLTAINETRGKEQAWIAERQEAANIGSNRSAWGAQEPIAQERGRALLAANTEQLSRHAVESPRPCRHHSRTSFFLDFIHRNFSAQFRCKRLHSAWPRFWSPSQRSTLARAWC